MAGGSEGKGILLFDAVVVVVVVAAEKDEQLSRLDLRLSSPSINSSFTLATIKSKLFIHTINKQ